MIDRYRTAAMRTAHQFGQSEAIDLRHVHVEQGQCHLVLEQQLQRLRARAGQQQVDPFALQQCLHGYQVLRHVIDDRSRS